MRCLIPSICISKDLYLEAICQKHSNVDIVLVNSNFFKCTPCLLEMHGEMQNLKSSKEPRTWVRIMGGFYLVQNLLQVYW